MIRLHLGPAGPSSFLYSAMNELTRLHSMKFKQQVSLFDCLNPNNNTENRTYIWRPQATVSKNIITTMKRTQAKNTERNQ